MDNLAIVPLRPTIMLCDPVYCAGAAAAAQASELEPDEAAPAESDLDEQRDMLTTRLFGARTADNLEAEDGSGDADLEANRTLLATRLFGKSAVAGDEAAGVTPDAEQDVFSCTALVPIDSGNEVADTNGAGTLQGICMRSRLPLLCTTLQRLLVRPACLRCSCDHVFGGCVDAQLCGSVPAESGVTSAGVTATSINEQGSADSTAEPEPSEVDLNAQRSMMETRLFGASARAADEADTEAAMRSMLATRLFGKATTACDEALAECDSSDDDAVAAQAKFGQIGFVPIGEDGNVSNVATGGVPESCDGGHQGTQATDPNAQSANGDSAAAHDARAASAVLDDLEQDLETQQSLLATRIFGASAAGPSAAAEHNLEAQRSMLETRLFGPQSKAVADGDGEDELCLETQRSLLATRLFGAHNVATGAAEDSELDLDAQRSMLTSRLFGAMNAEARGEQQASEADLDVQRSLLETRLFGDHSPAQQGAAGNDADLDLDVQRSMMETRLFGAGSKAPNAQHDAAESDRDAQRNMMETRLFGRVAEQPVAEAPASDSSAAFGSTIGRLSQLRFESSGPAVERAPSLSSGGASAASVDEFLSSLTGVRYNTLGSPGRTGQRSTLDDSSSEEFIESAAPGVHQRGDVAGDTAAAVGAAVNHDSGGQLEAPAGNVAHSDVKQTLEQGPLEGQGSSVTARDHDAPDRTDADESMKAAQQQGQQLEQQLAAEAGGTEVAPVASVNAVGARAWAGSTAARMDVDGDKGGGSSGQSSGSGSRAS